MPFVIRRPARRAPGAAVIVEESSAATQEVIEQRGSPAGMLMPLPDVLEHSASEPFRYCLNTSTVRGAKLSLPELVDIAAGAGYEAIEPWIDEIDRFAAEGGDLRDLRARIQDLGLTVESGIGFFEWIVDDDALRAKGMVEARRSMGMLARIGGKRIAAPPFGAQKEDAAPVDLLRAAERYKELLAIGDEVGVIPQVEVWGFSKNLNKLCEAALIAVESGHPDACILADVYHMYKGNSPLSGLRLLGGDAFRVFHVNDYPGIPRETIADGDRVYPGDGIAPLTPIFRTLRDIGFHGVLSLELFNKEYWQMDPLTVAREGMEKLREVVQKSLEP